VVITSFVLLSCNKKKPHSTVKLASIKNTKVKANDTIYIEKENLIIKTNNKQDIYNNLVVNSASLNTFLEVKNNHIFYLIYEYNASITKMQHIYKYIYRDSLILVFKEINKLNKGKFASKRKYFKNFIIKKQTYDSLEPILENVKTHYISAKKKMKMFLYDYDNNEFGNINSLETGLEKYLDVSNNLKNNINEDTNITNIEKANNTAYYLEQSGAFEETINLLGKIIDKDPNRAVAYVNLGDAYWGLGEKNKAQKAYKIYIKLMKEKGKEKQIPSSLLERIKGK